MTRYTDQTTQTVIVRANLPVDLNRALDHLAVDRGLPKSALLVEAIGELLAHHEREAVAAMSGGEA